MRALFGVLGLVLVLGLVGALVKKQLHAVAPTAVPSASEAGPTVREQSQQTQQRLRDDVQRALQQGAEARASEAAQ